MINVAEEITKVTNDFITCRPKSRQPDNSNNQLTRSTTRPLLPLDLPLSTSLPLARRAERAAAQAARLAQYPERRARRERLSRHPDRQPQREPILRGQHRPRRGQGEPGSALARRQLRRNAAAEAHPARRASKPPRRSWKVTRPCRLTPASTCKSWASIFLPTCRLPLSPSADRLRRRRSTSTSIRGWAIRTASRSRTNSPKHTA